MNDDLVEQLYLCAEDYWGELACEAATRIEALTARNKVLEDALRVCANAPLSGWTIAQACARRALGGEQK